MKKRTIVLLVVALGLLLAAAVVVPAWASSLSNPATTTVVASPQAVPLDAKSQIVFMGSGFEPGKPVYLIVDGASEMRTDISYLVSPQPVADAAGLWAVVWTLDTYVKVGSEGMHTIIVTDDQYNVLASAPFGLVNTSKPKDTWPNWGQALLGK